MHFDLMLSGAAEFLFRLVELPAILLFFYQLMIHGAFVNSLMQVTAESTDYE